MELTVEKLCENLTQSRLLSPHEVGDALRRWQDAAKEKTSISQFTRWLIRENLVTEYQASLLAKGHVDDFFLDDYKILQRVGRGQMAGVYKAMRGDGQIVAIKVLPPSRSRIPALLGRFQREARLSLKFDHPNVVRGFDVGETKGLHYLVMEFLEGETAEEMLSRRKQLPALEAGYLIRQALLGLHHLHEHDIVHRDLKPANLMLVPSPDGDRDDLSRVNVKILDIGLARPLFADSNPGVELSELTQEGVLLGTPDFLSPEQARDPRAIDIRSDLYSLGCVLQMLLTGLPPFPDGNILNQMLRHATEPPRPVRESNPSCPEAMQQILYYLLAKKPDQRYATPIQAAEALGAFLEGNASTPPPVVVPSPRPPVAARAEDAWHSIEVPEAEVRAIAPKPSHDWIAIGLGFGALVLIVAIGVVAAMILRG